MDKEILDCVVIGAGPAGLVAGIYLKRFRRNILIIDNKRSRAAIIPLSHNYPGFPQGISGLNLLERLNEQLQTYHGNVIEDTVIKIEKKKEIFWIQGMKTCCVSKKLILATGVCDVEPALPHLENAVRRGLIRHCCICDAYEVRDQRICVISNDIKGINEAFFLKNYSPYVTLATLAPNPNLFAKKLGELKSAHIRFIKEPISDLKFNKDKTVSITASNQTYLFDTVYSALGCKVNSQLALDIGAKSENNYILVNKHQESSVPGLFAIGDIVQGLSQICVATSHAAIAATQIHNCL